VTPIKTISQIISRGAVIADVVMIENVTQMQPLNAKPKKRLQLKLGDKSALTKFGNIRQLILALTVASLTLLCWTLIISWEISNSTLAVQFVAGLVWLLFGPKLRNVN
jgi:hypothetical protein